MTFKEENHLGPN